MSPPAEILAQIAPAIRAGGDPQKIIADVLSPLPGETRRAVLIQLAPHFCRHGQDFSILASLVQRLGVIERPDFPPPGPALAARLPFWLHDGQAAPVATALEQIAAQEELIWLPSVPIAWLARQAGTRPDLPAPERIRILRAVMAIAARHRADGPALAHCRELTAAAADLCRDARLPEELRAPWAGFCLSLYGATRAFWQHPAMQSDAPGALPLPAPLARARTAFARLSRSLTGAPDLAALALLEQAGCAGTPRLRRDLAPPPAPAPALQIRPSDPDLGRDPGTLELLTPPKRLRVAQTAPVVVIAAMRNEMLLLPHFLTHYRRLGVEAFLIADNLSDDGSTDFLAAQPDVSLFRAPGAYSDSLYGVAWQQALMAAFRRGKWSLLADADELLFWQHPQRQTLPELLASPDFAQAEAARIFMIDLYPAGPFASVDLRHTPPFEAAGYCDRAPLLADTLARGPFSDAPCWRSALRHRLLPGSAPGRFTAQKTPLLRYHPWINLAPGLHFTGDVRMARQELFFGHFKYHAGFAPKAETEAARGEHYNQAREYRDYLEMAGSAYDPRVSIRWQDCAFIRERMRGD